MRGSGWGRVYMVGGLRDVYGDCGDGDALVGMVVL